MHQYEETDPTPFEVWVHITCALWLPETYFQDKLTYFMVRGLENIDTKKFSMFCQICQTESIILLNSYLNQYFFKKKN